MLNAVLFDLDNTLVDRNRAFRACVNAHFRDPAVRAELLQLDHGGRGDREALFRIWSRRSGMAMNQGILGRLLAERLQPDLALIEVLRILATTLKLGIITNGGGETQRQKFLAAGLAKVIPHHRVWVSAEIGKGKPDPAIFLLASQALGELPENCLYIGDHEPDDLAGAMAAGMRVRLVDAVLGAERLNSLLSEERGR
jgi:putative hydrolase of the HAD superfamily